MKKTFFTILLLFFLTLTLHSQTISARFSSYFYTWQRFDSLSTTGGENTSTTHLRGYQNLLLEASSGKWSFNTLVQTEEDIIKKTGRGFGYRFYNAYVRGTNIANLLDVKIGRQWVSAGVGRGSIDGLNLKLKAGKDKEYQLALFGGALTPLDYRIQEYPSIKDNYQIGAQFSYYGIPGLTAALSYANKHRKPEPYTAIRADSIFNTTLVTIDTDSPADQMTGVDVSYYDDAKGYNIFGRGYYDINNKIFYRGELNARFNATNKLQFSAGYFYREPLISYNSLFSVFNFQRTQEIEAGVDYRLLNIWNIYGRVSDVFYEGSNSSWKIQLGFNHPQFGLNFTKFTGYSGESDGVNAYYYRELIRGMLSLNSALSYANYKLSEYDTEKVSSLSGLLGFTYRPNNRLSFDIQGQFVNNRIYKSDVRGLIGFNYWLFTKF